MTAFLDRPPTVKNPPDQFTGDVTGSDVRETTLRVIPAEAGHGTE